MILLFVVEARKFQYARFHTFVRVTIKKKKIENKKTSLVFLDEISLMKIIVFIRKKIHSKSTILKLIISDKM